MHVYEHLFESTSDAMCELDGEGRVLRVNRSCVTLLGGDPDPGSDLAHRFDEEGRAQLAKALHGLSEAAPTARFEGSLPDSKSWTVWQLTRIEANRVVAVGRDESKHHETARSLEQKSSFLQSIIEAEPECVKLVAPDGQLLDMNAAGLRMVGAKSRDEAIGANVYDLMAPEDRERFIEFNEQVCRGEGGELSFEIIALDGTRRSMETTAVPLEGLDGEVLQLAITRDVSQRHLLEGQLRQAQKIDAIGHLAGGVAHDFNNLLTAIIGPAELALMRLHEDDPIARDLRGIKETGERAARLTQKLLAFARQQVVQLRTLSMVELVSDAQEMLERLLGELVELEITLDAGVSPIRADRGHLEQVLVNLVVNARDALASEGRIRICVKNEFVGSGRAGRLGCKEGPFVALTVRDDGAGMTPEVIEQIFDPFFTTKPPGTGTGLGLSTCHGIVAQLGGGIDVESVVGEGTTVTVLIPATSAEVQDRPAAAVDADGGGEVILLAEDEEVVRDTIQRMLEVAGYVVHAAANGHGAIELARGLPELALLVTDMAMPGMSGSELAAELRRQRGKLPTLYVTGYLRDTELRSEFDHEQDAILHKPFKSATLLDAVARLLRVSPAVSS